MGQKFIYLHLCNSGIAHDSFTTQSPDLIEFNSIFKSIQPSYVIPCCGVAASCELRCMLLELKFG